jgi:hypothetical protein
MSSSLQQIQNRVNYLIYAINNDLSGNNISTNSFTTTSYVPRYAYKNRLRSFMDNRTIEFYGDGVTSGAVSLSNPSTENYAYLTCQRFTNCICDNHGVFNAVPYDFFNSLSTDMSGNQITQHISGRLF